MYQIFKHDLQHDDFSVAVSRVDGSDETVCQHVPAKDAALGFWHYCNNFSAKSGIVQKVVIRDGRDNALLAWEYNRGYTFDGEHFLERPVLMDS